MLPAHLRFDFYPKSQPSNGFALVALLPLLLGLLTLLLGLLNQQFPNLIDQILPTQNITPASISPTNIQPTSILSPTTNQYPTTQPTSQDDPSPVITPGSANGNGIWISQEDITKLPVQGAAWDSLVAQAAASWGSASVSDQDSNHDVSTMAGALVCARMGDYCDKTRGALISAVNTENGGRWLAVGRNVLGYTIAADIMRNSGHLTGNDLSVVSDWLSRFLTRTLAHNNNGSQIKLTPFFSGSNASAQEGAVYAAIAAYNNDRNALDYVWNRFRLFSCDKTNNPETEINITNGFEGGWSHASSLTEACAINPAGTEKSGHRIDGAIINDMVRGGEFNWPPGYTQYPWVGLEGYVPSAWILHRAGYPAFELQNNVVLRTLEFLKYTRDNTGNQSWFDGSRANEVIHLVNFVYGTDFPMNGPTGGGRTFGFSDWTHPR